MRTRELQRNGSPSPLALRPGAIGRFAAVLALSSAALVSTPLSRQHALGAGLWLLAAIVLGPPLHAAIALRPAADAPLPRRLAALLAAVVGLSGAVHLGALLLLPPNRPVNVIGWTTATAWPAVLEGTLLHLVLPASFWSFASLLERQPALAGRVRAAAALLLAPSAAWSLVQASGRIDAGNVDHFARLGRASGLSYDANSLAAGIFLALPFLVLALVESRPALDRSLHSLLLALLVAALCVTGNRTGLAALFAVAVLAPPLLLLAAPPARRGARWSLAALPVGATVLLLLMGTAELPWGGPSSAPARMAVAVKQFAAGDFGSTFDESSRLDLWRQAGRMLALAPVAGVGPGGFARELPNVRFDDSESPANQATDLAGSHYLQLAAELGLVGWVLHVALLMMALGAAVRRARRVGEAAARRRSLVTASALAIVLVLLQFNHYGLFPDFAWLLGALLATCTVETEGEPTSRRFRSKSRWRLAAAATLLLVLFASAFTACGDRGYRLRSEAEEWPLRHDHGCFPVESWGGVETRWCSPSASLAVPVALPGDRAVTISVLAMHPDLESLPLAVELCTLSERCQSTTFERSEWRRLTLPIERAALRTCRGPDGRRADCLVVRVAAARGWRPADWSDSQDDRWLGVAVRLRRLPDPSLAPGHLFSDSFESASLLSWRLGDEDADPGR